MWNVTHLNNNYSKKFLNSHTIDINITCNELTITRKYQYSVYPSTSGADPGFQKGGGTPREVGENLIINDIHDPLN